MDNEKIEKVKVLLSDEDFMVNLLSQNTAEDVKALFLEKEIEISDEDVELLGKMLIELVKRGGELSTEDLEKISGGIQLMYDGRDENNILFSTRICNCINTDVIRNRGNNLVIGDWIKSNKQNM